MTECTFSLGKQPYTYYIFSFKELSRTMILGLDFLRSNRIGTDWSQSGKFVLHQKEKIWGVFGNLYNRTKDLYQNHIDIPGRTLAVLNVTVDIRKEHCDTSFNVQANRLLINEYPNLIAIPTIHNVKNIQTQ